MTTLQVTGTDGTHADVQSEDVDTLGSQLRGGLLRPHDPSYDDARVIWNAMIDRRPAIIAKCAGAGDVIQCVRFAREHGILLAVKGGGHNIAGNAMCDGGMVIDLSPMNWVTVDPQARTAIVGPGATLGDVDHETQAFGLATPLGINSTTGVAGLTLGGGFGWLSRKYGLTIDNLLSAHVVTANGELLSASEDENADLFWGLRGGGGNFGIVTRFEFRLHPVGPQIYAGLIAFPFAQAKQVLTRYRDYVMEMTDDLFVMAVARKAPPLPFLPEEAHGKEMVAIPFCYSGEATDGTGYADDIRGFGDPIGEHVGAMPYTAWQQVLDPMLTPGARNYWKSHNFAALSDALIDTVIEFGGKVPSPHCEILLGIIGGQVNRVPVDATAYPHRDTPFLMNVHGRWQSAEEDMAGISWARELFKATESEAAGSVYVNFMPADETGRVAQAYGQNYERMVALKRKYDPDNLFRLNQNVSPK